jgi:hypothetical protein
MININGKVLDKLNENEYYLLSVLLNYGKQSSPDNGVLLHRTGWGLQKLQRTKKSLISKGFIAVKAQFKDKERGRSSNKYIIKSSLVSKYNGNQLHDFNIDENKLDEIQLDEIKLHENKLDENHTDYKVLKSISIETIKLLKDSFKKEEEEKKQLLEKIEALEAENKKLKAKKKQSDILKDLEAPTNFTDEIKNLFAAFVQMRKEIKKPYKSKTAIKTKLNSLSKQYQGINVSWIKDNQETQPQPETTESISITDHYKKYYPEKWQLLANSGKLKEYEAKFTDLKFKYSNIAKSYKNPTITAAFIFEAVQTNLHRHLSGSNEERRINSLTKWIERDLSDYKRNKADVRDEFYQWTQNKDK